MSDWPAMCEGADAPSPEETALEGAIAFAKEWARLRADRMQLDCDPNPYTIIECLKSERSPQMVFKLDAQRLAKARAE